MGEGQLTPPEHFYPWFILPHTSGDPRSLGLIYFQLAFGDSIGAVVAISNGFPYECAESKAQIR